jgi:hypothetical protein
MKYRVANTIAFIAMVMVNALAVTLPINGKTTKELSDQYPNLFVPAGITFSIWGVIYLSLLTVLLWQFFSTRLRKVIESLHWFVAINFLLNSLWIISWHYEFVSISVVIMVSLLATLVAINTKLMKPNELLPKFSFGIYLGWICLATIANITTLLVSFSWAGFGLCEEWWAISLILIGTLVGVFAMYKLKNSFLSLALAWGFIGIVLKREIDYPFIAKTAYFSIGISCIAVLALVVKRRQISS